MDKCFDVSNKRYIFAPTNNKHNIIGYIIMAQTRRKFIPEMDDEMKELMGVLAECVVPRSQRRAVVRTNYHAPYYSRGRYSYL